MVTILAVGLIVGAAFLLLKAQPAAEAPSKPVDAKSLVRENSHMTGKTDAKVTMVEFGDFQCPACGAVNEAVVETMKAYSSNPNFNFVFRNFPLPQHQNALSSAEAVEAAGAQGKYWQMHELVYKNQAQWENSNTALDIFAGFAQQLGIDVSKFKSEVQANKYAAVIEADKNDGLALGVDSTPTFFINGEKHVGVLSAADFKKLIDEKLK